MFLVTHLKSLICQTFLARSVGRASASSAGAVSRRGRRGATWAKKNLGFIPNGKILNYFVIFQHEFMYSYSLARRSWRRLGADPPPPPCRTHRRGKSAFLDPCQLGELARLGERNDRVWLREGSTYGVEEGRKARKCLARSRPARRESSSRYVLGVPPSISWLSRS